MGPRTLLALVLATSCAAPVKVPANDPVVPAETSEQIYHRARLQEATANGCGNPCPAADLCVDTYGLCWSACAWENVGKDNEARTQFDNAARNADPTSSFLITCKTPVGAREISHAYSR